ncbi:hypothetical protein ACJX0J_034541, partial [Zea mays]
MAQVIDQVALICGYYLEQKVVSTFQGAHIPSFFNIHIIFTNNYLQNTNYKIYYLEQNKKKFLSLEQELVHLNLMLASNALQSSVVVHVKAGGSGTLMLLYSCSLCCSIHMCGGLPYL